VAAALEELVILAGQDAAVSPYLHIRRGAVLEQRDALLEIADHLREPSPVSVDVVAKLSWLARDTASPAYIGGNPPAGLAEIAAHCGCAVRRDGERF
jgi:hypothetical protein